MSIFQILALLFALFMMYVFRLHYRRRVIGQTEMGLWWLVWLSFGVLALFPQWLQGIVGFLHFARVFDLLSVMAFMFITLVVVFLYLNQKATANKIEMLVRRLAIQAVGKAQSHGKS